MQGKTISIKKKGKIAQFCIKNFIGEEKRREIILTPIEALYLKEMKGLNIEIPNIKEFSKYLVYRDLRIKNFYPLFKEIKGEFNPEKIYKGKAIKFPEKIKEKLREKIKVRLTKDKYCVLEGESNSLKKFIEHLYKKHWFGQIGVYKKSLGNIIFLERFEALFLEEKGFIKLKEKEKEELKKGFKDHYEVFKYWRERGFVIKTGFKFGTDFRIYEVGVNPFQFQHSLSVLHVFPRGFKMKVEELSRAIRVANSVRKTFILAIPKYEERFSKPDFYCLGKEKIPIYAIKCFSQEGRITSLQISSLLNEVSNKNLKLLLAIADREGGITYYEVNKIKVVPHGESNFNYFEVVWKKI